MKKAEPVTGGNPVFVLKGEPVVSNNSIVKHAAAVPAVIVTDAQEALAEDLVRRGAALEKAITEHYRKILKPIEDERKAHLQPIRDVLYTLRGKIGLYLSKKAQAALEASEKRNLEMQQLTEQGRKKEIRALVKAGKIEEAQALKDEELPTPVTFAETTKPVGEGVWNRKVWKWRVVDAKKIPREYLCVDEKKVNAIVRDLKESTDIPGIEVYEETAQSFRKAV